MKQIVYLINQELTNQEINNLEKQLKSIESIHDIIFSIPNKKIYINISNEQDINKINKLLNEELHYNITLQTKKAIIHHKEPFFSLKRDWYIIVGLILFLLSLVFENNYFLFIILTIISYLILGKNIFKSAFKNISNHKFFTENILMLIATIGAMLIKQYHEAIVLLLFFDIGELFQDYAIAQTRSSIREMMDLHVDTVNLEINGEIMEVDPASVKIGDTLVIKPGERIAVDGIITSGSTQVDTSSITGEFVPQVLHEGDKILSGFVNISNNIKMEVTTLEKESTANRILHLVEDSNAKKTKIETFIRKFAKIYTPIIFAIALIVGIVPSIFQPELTTTWIYRALTLLVIGCPCAIVISIPLGLFAGIGGASKQGILIKSGNYLEALNLVDTIVFDKTGTLTEGKFEIVEIKSFSLSEAQLLEIAAYGEFYSNHPIGKSIVQTYNKNIKQNLISEFQEILGSGVSFVYNQHQYNLGNEKFLKMYNLEQPQINTIGTKIFVIEDQQLIGYIIIGDQLKVNAKRAITNLKKLGIRKTVMLTGDSYNNAKQFADELNIDEVHANLLPDQKIEELEKIKQSANNLIAFVGDGMNDAPSLARVDVGISMGGLGSDVAIEASDIVIMNDEPLNVAQAIVISRKVKNILKQNIVISLLIKFLVMIFVISGFANMWWGVIADVGVTLLAVINAMRALKIKNKLK